MRSKTILTTAFALCLLTGVATAGSLDGKTFTVMIDDPTVEEPYEDTLIFEDGKFRSVACDEYGFDWAPYTTQPMAGGIVRFEVTAESEEEGTNHWVGKVANDGIKGEFTWTKEGQEPIEYSFEGAIAEEEAADEEMSTDGP